MVLWFSGTGNSHYLGKRVADGLGTELVSMFDKIKNNDYSQINSNDVLVFAVPTYGWRIPRVVSDYINKVDFTGNKRAYFLMSCGGEIGNAQKYLQKLCENKGFEFMGVMDFLMPENYIAMFGAPEKDEAIEIIKKVEPRIDETISIISSGKKIQSNKPTLADKLRSGIVNEAFYSICVKDKSFYTTDECIGCGICVKNCPLNNITMQDKKPVWNGECTHCMSCICKCPKEAIEYGNKSKNLPRYTCPNI